VEYVLGVDFGIDGFFYGDPNDLYLGRMSPLSSLGFVLLGSAMALLHARPQNARLAESLVLGQLLVSFVVVVGYLYGLGAPFGLGKSTPMALNTACAFGIAGTGALLANPAGAVIGRLLSTTGGGRTARVFLPSVILVPLVVGGVLRLGAAAGWYGEAVEDALYTVATVLTLASLTWAMSGRLARIDEARARDERALVSSSQRLQLLVEVSEAIAAAGLDPELVASAVVGSLTDVLGDGVALMVLEGDTLRTVSFAHRDTKAQIEMRELLLKRPLRVGEGVAGRAAALGKTILLPEPPSDAYAGAREYAELHRRDETGAVLAVPMFANDRVSGALVLMRSRGAPVYGVQDRLLVEELAGRAALALQNVTLYERAQAAVRLRDEFLSVASHELRTPLTSLKLMIGGALHEGRRAGEVSPRIARLERVDVQLQRMTKLVDQLLDVSRLVDGRLAIESQDTDLRVLTEGILGWFKEQAARSSCELRLSGDAHVVGRWDPSRIGQVITNLLSNALKYGAGAPVDVRVEQLDGAARVTVEDHGIGVALDDQVRIFERFARASSVRNYGGLGLGLWISKQIVEKHGGAIRVSSRPGEGAAFVVEQPLEAPAADGGRA
jgi:signal transduction histidine kinase